MHRSVLRLVFPLLLLAPAGGIFAAAGEAKIVQHRGPADAFFLDELWPKVAAQDCLKCHKPGGEAEDSEFILRDPKREKDDARDEALGENRAAFARMAAVKKDGESRLLLKATGKIKHGGKVALEPASAGYRVLAEFVRRVNAPGDPKLAPAVVGKNAPPFFRRHRDAR